MVLANVSLVLCHLQQFNPLASAKAATLNDGLQDRGRYGKPQWRLVQAWLDIGNSVAHGKFSDYNETVPRCCGVSPVSALLKNRND